MRKQLKAALVVGSTLWCLTIVAAPALHLSSVHRLFSVICHQDPERSWHIFGKPLPVCIRCASIYFAFCASLWFGLRANIRWFRVGLLFAVCEFVVTRLAIDSAVFRSIAGVLVGLTAAPFVKQGVEELCDFL